MSKKNGASNKLQLQQSETENRGKFEPSSAFWYDLVVLMFFVWANGGAFSVYTSADGNATAFSIKSGKSRRAYWIGPDDDYREVLEKAERDWAVSYEVDPLYEQVRRVANEVMSEVQNAQDA